MRLVTFAADASSALRVGLIAADGAIVDIGATAARAGMTLPFDAGDMVSLIAAGESARDALRHLAAAASAVCLPESAVRLLAPIPRPRKNVFCVGWNYLEHFAEGEAVRKSGDNLPEHPVFFSKAVTAVIGPFDTIPFDARVSAKLDWEVELGVVIGRHGKNIRQADALDHVFGYTVIDDVSARDLQRQHGGQWLKGKSLDGTCPMGPCIVTRDELDAGDLRLTTRVNGVVKQDSRTRHLYFSLPRLIEELSLGMTLEPGDVLSTGTPQGVGFARNPPEFLAPGDVVESEIEGIGCLRNRVVAVD
ncbi:MAG: fumarylacetoacetate hydrolase family protein [Betaproteobacteria bacterium]|nr:fumarylacetoacetate hydrolase family protein [Betaproteobacteria bacterium]